MLACLLGAPPNTFGFHVSRWESKCITVIGPYALFMLRNNGRVIVWSPPSVIKRGSVLPFLEMPTSFALVAGSRINSALWPSSIWWMAHALSYLNVC